MIPLVDAKLVFVPAALKRKSNNLIPPVDAKLVIFIPGSLFAALKILDDARSELQLRRVRVSAENKKFASDMRRKVDRVLAERRQESEASSLEGVATSVSDVALVATNTHKTIDTFKTTTTDETIPPVSPSRK